jgi:hypothetical protein
MVAAIFNAGTDNNKVGGRQRGQREETCNNQIKVTALVGDDSEHGNEQWCLTLVVIDSGKMRVARTTEEFNEQRQYTGADGGGNSGGGNGSGQPQSTAAVGIAVVAAELVLVGLLQQ